MPARIACPSCGASYGVDESHLGRQARCRKCGTVFSVSGTQIDNHAVTADLQPIHEPAPGQVFAGRYKVEKPLGAGGMGAVFLARDLVLDRPVALKVPHFRADGDAKAVQRFEREARIAARFRHPNLCPVLDVGQIEGVRYITMPLIDGEPLTKLIEAGPVDQARAAQIVRTLALALAEAHELGVVHRDLKPANILLDRKLGPVVVDFGLAQPELGEADARLTKTGDFLGTVPYMSPEQIDADPKRIGSATDVYAVGVILYELLTGQRPFQGAPTSLVWKIKAEAPPPLSEHRPNVDPALAAIALKAMAKAPGDRFGSMMELAAALVAWRDKQPGRASVASQKLMGLPSAKSPPVEVPMRPRRRVPATPEKLTNTPTAAPPSAAVPVGTHPRLPRRIIAWTKGVTIFPLGRRGRPVLKGALWSVGFVLSMVGFGAGFSTLVEYSRGYNARLVELGRTEGIDALDRGEFDRAHMLLAPAARAVMILKRQIGGKGEIVGADEVRQAAREAAIYADLIPVALEAILEERARASDDAAWADSFSTKYEGRAILIEGRYISTPTGKAVLDYRVLTSSPTGSRAGQVAVSDLHLLAGSVREPNEFVRFGARLAGVERGPGGEGWLFRLDTESGVRMTHSEALVKGLGWQPSPAHSAASEQPKTALDEAVPWVVESGNALINLTPDEVRDRMGGEPERVARSASQGQYVEQWIYPGPEAIQYVNFLKPAGSEPACVIGHFSLPTVNRPY